MDLTQNYLLEGGGKRKKKKKEKKRKKSPPQKSYALCQTRNGPACIRQPRWSWSEEKKKIWLWREKKKFEMAPHIFQTSACNDLLYPLPSWEPTGAFLHKLFSLYFFLHRQFIGRTCLTSIRGSAEGWRHRVRLAARWKWGVAHDADFFVQIRPASFTTCAAAVAIITKEPCKPRSRKNGASQK